MANLTCRDYGYDCDFQAEGEIEDVIKQFREHCLEEHGIDYSREGLIGVVKRKEK